MAIDRATAFYLRTMLARYSRYGQQVTREVTVPKDEVPHLIHFLDTLLSAPEPLIRDDTAWEPLNQIPQPPETD